MAVTLRLSRHGKKKNPFYRIVATETGFRRDGKYIEIVGSYNPMQDPPLVVLKEERVAKIKEARRARKERAKERA